MPACSHGPSPPDRSAAWRDTHHFRVSLARCSYLSNPVASGALRRAPGWNLDRRSFTLRSKPDNTRCTMASAAGRVLFVVTDAERAVADLLPIEAEPAAARGALERVPLWFHTFALNREHGLYT